MGITCITGAYLAEREAGTLSTCRAQCPRFALAHRYRSETAVVPCNTGTIGLSAVKNAFGYREGQ